MVTINTESALTPRSLRDTRRMNMFVSVAAAVAGLLFGLDIGVIAGALPFITDHFVLTSRLQEWVVSSMMPVQQLVRCLMVGCRSAWVVNTA